MNVLTTKTVLGAILSVVGWLLSPEVLATMSQTVAGILQAVGYLLTIVGVRSALVKAGAPVGKGP